jgi:hypothetical protein
MFLSFCFFGQTYHLKDNTQHPASPISQHISHKCRPRPERPRVQPLRIQLHHASINLLSPVGPVRVTLGRELKKILWWRPICEYGARLYLIGIW